MTPGRKTAWQKVTAFLCCGITERFSVTEDDYGKQLTIYWGYQLHLNWWFTEGSSKTKTNNKIIICMMKVKKSDVNKHEFGNWNLSFQMYLLSNE